MFPQGVEGSSRKTIGRGLGDDTGRTVNETGFFCKNESRDNERRRRRGKPPSFFPRANELGNEHTLPTGAAPGDPRGISPTIPRRPQEQLSTSEA